MALCNERGKSLNAPIQLFYMYLDDSGGLWHKESRGGCGNRTGENSLERQQHKCRGGFSFSLVFLIICVGGVLFLFF